jgi:hypothetical protein
VARKDTFIDTVQLPAAMGAVLQWRPQQPPNSYHSSPRCRGAPDGTHRRRSRHTSRRSTERKIVNSTWKVEWFAPILFTGGFFVHVVNASRNRIAGGSELSGVLLWPVDLSLTAIMLFCAVALIARRKAMFARYDLASPARRIGYWLITFYVCVSLPGHFLFLTTGNTRYFDAWPEWYSIVVLPVYVLMAAFFISLRPLDGSAVLAVSATSKETVR